MIEEIKKDALEKGVPIIKDEGLAFLLNFIDQHHCKDILELGTAVGYSAIMMANSDPDIMIDTIEKNEDMYDQAVNNIKDCGLEDRIEVHFSAIVDFKTAKMYDLIFIDAAKAQYGRYMEMFLNNLKDNGYMLFDNMVFHGLVEEPEKITSRNLRNLVKKIIKFREMVQNDNRFDIMMFDNVGDGILVLNRRKSET
ncbi:MAG: O-methyltransferase [Erysipelotrichaceae bacterium]|nr:O-methyltransferase [Erysipelotrichaceae bacterium]